MYSAGIARCGMLISTRKECKFLTGFWSTPFRYFCMLRSFICIYIYIYTRQDIFDRYSQCLLIRCCWAQD
ncbi:hypothetical protein BDV19DRAFT_354103, partial [Aspergillus venezuelensis]